MITVWTLFITYPASGHVSVRTFPDLFSRNLEIIALSPLPLILRTAEY